MTATVKQSADTAAVTDPDVLYAAYLARAAALASGALGGADALAGDIAASPLPESTFKALANAIAKATGLDSDPIKKSIVKARRKYEGATHDEADDALPPRSREELEAACHRILGAPDVLDELRQDLPRMGAFGEVELGLGTYVAVQSRRQPRPLNVLSNGPSGSGKSYNVEITLKLIPPTDIYEIGDASEKMLQYDKVPLKGKAVYMREATPMQRDNNSPLAYAMRTLMSEGVSVYKYVDFENRLPGQDPPVREIRREGPAAVVITTTAESVHPEIETRMLRFPTDPSVMQTRRIQMAQAVMRGQAPPTAIIEEWRAFDEWLRRFGYQGADVPFRIAMVQAMSNKITTRMRRDNAQILTCCEVIALLNQRHRQLDAQGRVVAVEADWNWTRQLLNEVVSRGNLLRISRSALQVFKALKVDSDAQAAAHVLAHGKPAGSLGAPASGGTLVFPVDVSVRRVARAAGVDPSTVSRTLRTLREGGYVQPFEPAGGRSQPDRYIIVAEPDERGEGVLPTWEQIAQRFAPAPAPTPTATAADPKAGQRRDPT